MPSNGKKNNRPNGPGRPTKLTPAVQKMICDKVEAGVPFDNACRLAGINPDTGYEWIRRGQQPAEAATADSAGFSEFSEAIACARAKDEARRLKEITQAGSGGYVVWEKTTTHKDGRVSVERKTRPPDWRAHAWTLEHRDPERWARRDAADATVPPPQPVDPTPGLVIHEGFPFLPLERQAALKALEARVDNGEITPGEYYKAMGPAFRLGQEMRERGWDGNVFELLPPERRAELEILETKMKTGEVPFRVYCAAMRVAFQAVLDARRPERPTHGDDRLRGSVAS